MKALWIALPVLLTGCGEAGSELFAETDQLINVVYAMFALALVMFALPRDQGILKSLGQLAIFGALILAMVVGYSYRGDLKGVAGRVKAELLPGTPAATGEGLVQLTRANDGHFSTLALVNGRPVVFLIDTGATSVVLPFKEAMRVGFNSGDLLFNRPVSTANGTAYAAPILIEKLEIEGIVVPNVHAAVAEPGRLETPLMGMSFLNRLSRFSFERDLLTLEQ